jgi:hypothetical protein
MADGLVTLVEATAYDPSVTNKLVRSEELDNAGWGKSGATITANATLAPDGSATADTIVETATNAFHVVSQYVSGITAGVPVMASGHLKAAGRSRVRIQTDTSPNNGTADFDLATGTISGTTGIASAPRLIPLGNGWWRFAVLWTPTSSVALGIKLILASGSFGIAYAGDGVSGMHAWGFMLDPSGQLNDYVRTTSAAGPGTRVLRFASGRGRTTGPTDTPPHVHFAPRLQQPVNFSRTLFSNARITGGASVGAGEIVLNNTDQALASLRSLGLDGRDITVRVGAQDAPYPSGFTTFLTGTAEQVEIGARTATIRLRDRLQLLSLPLQANRYAGGNVLPSGAEGTADDIKGQPKPLLYGRRYQVPPVLVNTAKLTYQLHDGPMQAVDAVYDMGVALTAGADFANLAALEAAAPAAGTYITCLALGLFRLGAAPAGRITADARGENTGGYVSKAGEIVQRILTSRCGVAAGDLDAMSFTVLNTAVAGECGVFLTGETTRQQALDLLLASAGAWLAPTRTGTWQVGQLVAPAGTPVATLTDVEILSLDSRATNDDTRGVPVWRVTVRYKLYSQAAAADIAGSVSAARRAELLQPWRDTTASDPTIQAKHLLAQELVRETSLTSAADAAAEAARLLALHGVRRDFVQAEVWLSESAAALDLGQVVRLVTPRLGYLAGRGFVVVGIALDGRRQRLTLDLWG